LLRWQHCLPGQALGLSSCERINFEALAALTSLQTLFLSRCKQLRDLNPLAKLIS
jgi:hypothetical protein